MSYKKRTWRCCCMIFLLLTVTFTLFASNRAIIHPIDSPLMKDLRVLYISQGLALPSTAGPWSTDELIHLLDRLDQVALSFSEQRMYDDLRARLTVEKKAVDFNIKVNLESYTHINTQDFTTQQDWVYSYLERKPFVSFPVQMALGPFAGFVDFSLVNRSVDDQDSHYKAVDGVSDLFGKHYFTTNLPLQTFNSDLYTDANVPYYAALSAGGLGWGMEIGRQRLSWGPGYSGNFLLGDHVQYHNMARLTAYRDAFKYSFVTSFFPHPDEIGNFTDSHGQGNDLLGLKMLIAHRFEWRFANDRFGLALNESIMYQSRDGVDLRILNPMMLYHNYYIRRYANSLATAEFNWAVAKKWNLYGQIAVDELSFGPTEWNLPDNKKHPDGLAVMLGASYAHVASKGVLTGHIEGVYTDPYLYLRSIHGDKSQSGDADNLNFVVAMRRWFPDSVVYDQEYLGYTYGGDAIVMDLGLEYRVIGDWSLAGRLFGMVHGDVGPLTHWKLGELERAPSGIPTYYIQAGLSASKVLGSFEVYSSFDYLSRIRKREAVHDAQLVVGAGWSWR